MASESLGNLQRRYGVKARSRVWRDFLVALAMLREQGVVRVWRHAVAVALWRLHAGLVDRRAYAGLPHVFLDEFVVQDCNLKASSPDEVDDAEVCRTIPAKLLDWMLDGLDIDPRTHCFVDIGSGSGVAVLRAARRPFLKAIGVEFASEVHDGALANLDWARRHWPIEAGVVELRNESALETELPDTPCVVMLFNPFRGRVMSGFVEHLLRAHRRNPRPMTILYLNPLQDWAFQRPEFAPLPLRRRQRMLLATLSPVPVRAYRVV